MSFINIERHILLPRLSRREYVKNWWDLSRGENVALGIGTICLGALMMGVGYEESILTLALHAFCIGAFIAGWFAINDLLDIDVDRINHPDRPLPSDSITEAGAKKYGNRMIILSGVALLAIMLNDVRNVGEMAWVDSVAIWLVALLLMIAYEVDGKPFNPSLKKRMFWGNLTIAGTISISILFGAAAIDHATDPLLWVVAFSAMLLTTAREMIMDCRDQLGDFDRKTFAKVRGAEKARKTVWRLAVGSSIVMLLVFAMGFLPWRLVIFILPSVVCTIAVRPFLRMGYDWKAGNVLRLGMVFGLLGLAICGIISNH